MRRVAEVFLSEDGRLKLISPSEEVNLLLAQAIRPVARQLVDLLAEIARTRYAAAQEFLLKELSNGPLPSSDLKEKAGRAGHAWSTIRRAKSTLKVRSVQGSGHWWWQLP
jgi:hypothetical protein